jgi:hypothetical protein
MDEAYLNRNTMGTQWENDGNNGNANITGIYVDSGHWGSLDPPSMSPSPFSDQMHTEMLICICWSC